MKKILFLVSVIVLIAAGRSEAGVLNILDAGDYVQMINSLEPSIAFGYDFASEERIQTATASLFTLKNKELPLGSLRAGFAGQTIDEPRSIIGAVEFVTPNLVRRFIPEKFRDWEANLKFLTLIPSFSGIVGYNLTDDDNDSATEKDWIYGFTIGPKITF